MRTISRCEDNRHFNYIVKCITSSAAYLRRSLCLRGISRSPHDELGLLLPGHVLAYNYLDTSCRRSVVRLPEGLTRLPCHEEVPAGADRNVLPRRVACDIREGALIVRGSADAWRKGGKKEAGG